MVNSTSSTCATCKPEVVNSEEIISYQITFKLDFGWRLTVVIMASDTSIWRVNVMFVNNVDA